MRALGNTVYEPTFAGLIAGTRQTDGWLVVVNYIKEGYIKDDDAKNWNADELLANLRRSTEEANKDRLARGFPEVEVLGWVETPAYDASTHRLVWSVSTALSYDAGKRYEDFNASTDHIAEYGLAALVGGVVAKKLGLFALIGVFLVKFAKVIGVAVFAFGAGIWNFLRRRLKSASPTA